MTSTISGPEMRASNADCPSCGSQWTSILGPIPSSIMFAGRILDEPIIGGTLYRCNRCHFGFRFPRLGKQALDALYRGGQDDTWSTNEPLSRNDWNIARQWINQHLEFGRILDVGCFDGGFLTSLDQKYDKYGVEIHPEAAKHAVERGVNIIASDLTQLPKVDNAYDVVTSFDVIEHVGNPREFLYHLASRTNDKGAIIVSTGNLDSRAWRFMGSRYWYCTIPEHISFVSPRWFMMVAPELNLRVVNKIYYSHEKATSLVKLTQFMKNIGYRISPTFAGWLRSHGLAGRMPVSTHPQLKEAPPGWIAAQDHFLVVLRKT
ncbi:MAG: methyltransferase domain-containing protein [Ferrovum sp.]|nr:methyltransferase domain-containing protein [Ferrovum sp.]